MLCGRWRATGRRIQRYPACDVCAVGKTTAWCVLFSLSSGTSPITPAALGSFIYASKHADQKTKWEGIFLIKAKNNAIDTLSLFVKTLVNPAGIRLDRLRMDKGGEYTRKAFQDCCLQTGIKQKFVATNIPQQIGANKRGGRTLAGMVRFLLTDSCPPQFLWRELMQTAVYLMNKVPHAALDNTTPYKAPHGEDASRHRGQGFVHVETHTKKLDPQAWEGRLVGYSMESKAFHIYNPAKNNVKESRNATFIETPYMLPEPDLTGFDAGSSPVRCTTISCGTSGTASHPSTSLLSWPIPQHPRRLHTPANFGSFFRI